MAIGKQDDDQQTSAEGGFTAFALCPFVPNAIEGLAAFLASPVSRATAQFGQIKR